MPPESKGRDLFIVDNSVSGWTGLRYLEEWSGIAKAFDIATGYFEIGALLALDGKWQTLEKIRILTDYPPCLRPSSDILNPLRKRTAREVEMSGSTAKQKVLEAIEKLPADATLEDAIERLVFLAKIERGLAELDAGQGVEHSEAKRRLIR